LLALSAASLAVITAIVCGSSAMLVAEHKSQQNNKQNLRIKKAPNMK